MIIAPSILSCDFSDLKGEIESVSNAEYIHVDVMDGHFVPNITIGPVVLKSIGNIKKQVYDVHLMISDPTKYMIDFAKAKADIITFHYEALKNKEDVMDCINYIKQNNCRVGLAIKPNTSIEEIYEFLPYIHMCLIMTVEPGKGGQTLLHDMIDKIIKIKQYITENEIDIDIEADGGINLRTVEEIKKAGANILVAGTAILKANDYSSIINELKA